MRPESETQSVMLELPVHIELVRILKDVFISVGRLVRGDNSLTRLDELQKSISHFESQRARTIICRHTWPPMCMSTFAVRFNARAEPV